MHYDLPPRLTDVVARFRLNPEHAETISKSTRHVYVRNEIGGATEVVTDVKAFVAEVRALRGKPKWK